MAGSFLWPHIGRAWVARIRATAPAACRRGAALSAPAWGVWGRSRAAWRRLLPSFPVRVCTIVPRPDPPLVVRFRSRASVCEARPPADVREAGRGFKRPRRESALVGRCVGCGVAQASSRGCASSLRVASDDGAGLVVGRRHAPGEQLDGRPQLLDDLLGGFARVRLQQLPEPPLSVQLSARVARGGGSQGRWPVRCDVGGKRHGPD